MKWSLNQGKEDEWSLGKKDSKGFTGKHLGGPQTHLPMSSTFSMNLNPSIFKNICPALQPLWDCVDDENPHEVEKDETELELTKEAIGLLWKEDNQYREAYMFVRHNTIPQLSILPNPHRVISPSMDWKFG